MMLVITSTPGMGSRFSRQGTQKRGSVVSINSNWLLDSAGPYSDWTQLGLLPSTSADHSTVQRAGQEIAVEAIHSMPQN